MHTNLPNVTLVSPLRGGLPRGFDVTYPAKQVPGHTRNTWDETRPQSHRRPLRARHAVRLGSRMPCGNRLSLWRKAAIQVAPPWPRPADNLNS